jgi:hypothetical protein
MLLSWSSLAQVRSRGTEQRQAHGVPGVPQRHSHGLGRRSEQTGRLAAAVRQFADARERLAAGEGLAEHLDELVWVLAVRDYIQRRDHVSATEEPDRPRIPVAAGTEAQHVGKEEASVWSARFGFGPVEIVGVDLAAGDPAREEQLAGSPPSPDQP